IRASVRAAVINQDLAVFLIQRPSLKKDDRKIRIGIFRMNLFDKLIQPLQMAAVLIGVAKRIHFLRRKKFVIQNVKTGKIKRGNARTIGRELLLENRTIEEIDLRAMNVEWGVPFLARITVKQFRRIGFILTFFPGG